MADRARLGALFAVLPALWPLRLRALRQARGEALLMSDVLPFDPHRRRAGRDRQHVEEHVDQAVDAHALVYDLGAWRRYQEQAARLADLGELEMELAVGMPDPTDLRLDCPRWRRSLEAELDALAGRIGRRC